MHRLYLAISILCNLHPDILMPQVIACLLNAILHALIAFQILANFKVRRNLRLIIRQQKAPAAQYIPETQRKAALDSLHGNIQVNLAEPKYTGHLDMRRNTLPAIHIPKKGCITSGIDCNALPSGQRIQDSYSLHF